jgi:hypothetical protein
MLIPFELKHIKNPDNSTSLIAVISMKDATIGENTRVLLKQIQKEYSDLVLKCIKQIKKIQNSRKNQSNPILHWELGDAYVNFIKYVEENGFYFSNFVNTLTRDTGTSERAVTYHVRFRNEYKKNEINPNIKRWGYQELLDISNQSFRKKCEKKLIGGEIKTRTELRKFKKSPRLQ